MYMCLCKLNMIANNIKSYHVIGVYRTYIVTCTHRDREKVYL